MTKPFEGYTFTTEGQQYCYLVLKHGLTLCSTDWGKAPEEDFAKNEGDAMWNYVATKIVAERAAWDFAKENPKLDLAISKFFWCFAFALLTCCMF